MSANEEEGLISAGKSREKEDEQSTRKFVERFKDLFQNDALNGPTLLKDVWKTTKISKIK